MIVLSDISDLVRAVTDLIKEVRPKHPEPRIDRPHELSAGVCDSGCIHSGGMIIVAHCQRCGKLGSRALAGERCSYFT